MGRWGTCALAWAVSAQWASASPEVSHVGRIEDPLGVPVSMTTDLTFRLYRTEEASSAYWTEVHEDVVVDGGAYRVVLGSVTSLADVPLDGAYVGISVGGDELVPRQPVARMRDGLSQFRCEPGEVARATTEGWTCGQRRASAGTAEIPVSQSGTLPSSWTQVSQRTFVAFDWDGFADQVGPGRALEARVCMSFTDSGTGSAGLGVRVYRADTSEVLWTDRIDSTQSGSGRTSSDCGSWVPVADVAACAVGGPGQCRVEMMHEQGASTTVRRMWWEVSVN